MTTDNTSEKAKIRIKLQPKSLGWALLLKCPTCGESKLLKKGSLLTFNRGCRVCNYTYEREPGYFWGQSMMISYPFLGLFLVLIGYLLKYLYPEMSAYKLSTILFAASIPTIILSNPHCRVLWMLFDLYFNPINDKDSYLNESK